MINAWQIVFLAFFVLVIAVSAWAVIAIWKSEHLRFKPLWTIGSLLGFIGLKIDWTTANDLILNYGVSIPMVRVWWLLGGDQTYAHAMFPVVALIVLLKIRSLEKDTLIAVFDDDQRG